MFGKTKNIVITLIIVVALRVVLYMIQFLVGNGIVHETLSQDKSFLVNVKVNEIKQFEKGASYIYVKIISINCEKGFLLNGAHAVIKLSRQEFKDLQAYFQDQPLEYQSFQMEGKFVESTEVYNLGQVNPIIKKLGSKSIGRIQMIQVTTSDVKKQSFYPPVFRKILQDLSHFRRASIHFLTTKIQSMYEQPTQGIVIAMLLGNRDFLEDQIIDLYKEQGIIHMIAISGLHVGFLYLGMDYILRLGINSMVIRGVLCCGLLLLYNGLIGFNISAIRATGMLCVYIVSVASGKAYCNKRCLLSVGAISLIILPESLFQSGFLLSYSAVMGLFYLHPRLKKYLNYRLQLNNETNFLRCLVKESVNLGSISLSVNIMTTPILMYFFGGLSLSSLMANCLIAPIMCIYFLFMLLSVLVGCIVELVGKYVSFIVVSIEYYIQWVGTCFNAIPLNFVVLHRPNFFEVTLYYLLVLIFFRLISKESECNDCF